METICGIVSENIISEKSVGAMLTSMRRNDVSGFQEMYTKGDTIRVFCGKNAQEKVQIFCWENYGVLLEGKIINRSELCGKLAVAEKQATIETDEQLILSAYQKWGEDFLHHLNGMFALVIFDFVNQKILMARDRLGKKNLYYAFENGNLIFASELKAFFACDWITPEINTDGLGHFIKAGFVPAPDTVLKGVYKLPAGHCAVLENRVLRQERYWDPVQVYKQFKKQKIRDYTQAKTELEELIKTCIADRIGGEEQFGVFLSSGIDSSVMTALTTLVSQKQVKTYTIGVNDKKFNEADIAAKIASHLGTEHHEHYITEQDLLDCIQKVPLYYDEPFGDSSMIPSMILNRFVSDKVTLALGGDGGDEVFCGYPHYKVLPIAQRYDFLGGILHAVLPRKWVKKLPHSVQRVIENRNCQTKSQMIMKEEIDFLDGMLKHPFKKPYYEWEGKLGVVNWQQRRMLLDMLTTLPDDMIYKVNRACAYGNVEVFAPLLDYRIVEFSFRLPRKFKFHKGVTKKILREIATKYIPFEILNTPKRGFSVPAETWLKTSLKETLLRCSNAEFLEKQDLFDPAYVSEHLSAFLDGKEKGGDRWWNFLMFQLWYEQYMK